MITEFVVTAGEQPKRLDVFLVNRERDMSRSRLQRLIELGRIRINDQAVRPSQTIKPGDKITMDVPKPEPLELQGEAIPLEGLFEDEHLRISRSWWGGLADQVRGRPAHPVQGRPRLRQLGRLCSGQP